MVVGYSLKNDIEMKKIIYIFALLALFVATSCQKEAGNAYKFVGDWHYTATENGVAEDVWVSFSGDATFEMYQKIGDGPYWYSKGEFEYDEQTGVLAGVYSYARYYDSASAEYEKSGTGRLYKCNRSRGLSCKARPSFQKRIQDFG